MSMKKVVNAFVQGFTAKKAQEEAEARAEYLALLRRVARGEPTPDDTHERTADVLARARRTPEDFVRDTEELAELLRLSDLARALPAREARRREARDALADAREELKRVIREGEARLAELDTAHDHAADEQAEAHAARDQLLDLLGDRSGYYARLDDLGATRDAGADKDEEKLAAELERVTAALLDLAAYDPFRPRESPS